MNLQKHIKEIVITLSVISITAGAYATLSNVSTGDGLTATLWNSMVADVNSNTTKLTNISSNGANVGIGVASPIGTLDVGGLTMFGSTTKQMATSVIGGLLTSYSWDKTTSNHVDWEIRATSGTQLYLKSNGNVGIGHANPSQLLHVNGTALSAGWNTSSDIRKKENIKPIVKPLEKIEKLRGVTFKWKESKKEDTGVIAQEVEKEFPEFVTTGTDGYKSVDYAKLVAPLIESVKELKKENDEKDKIIEKIQKENQKKDKQIEYILQEIEKLKSK